MTSALSPVRRVTIWMGCTAAVCLAGRRLGMRADAVMPSAKVDWSKLTALLERAMNDDPHPAVRAWASKAAWQWWVWNPPVREAVNRAWVRMLERPEPSALVENNNRYSSQTRLVGGVNLVVPNSNIRVEEQRGEIFATGNLIKRPGILGSRLRIKIALDGKLKIMRGQR